MALNKEPADLASHGEEFLERSIMGIIEIVFQCCIGVRN